MKPRWEGKIFVWSVAGNKYGLMVGAGKLFLEVNDVEGRKFWEEIDTGYNDLFPCMLHVIRAMLSSDGCDGELREVGGEDE